jgi:hypothetical protein
MKNLPFFTADGNGEISTKTSRKWLKFSKPVTYTKGANAPHTQSYLSAAAALDAGKECPGCQSPRPVHRLPVIVRAPRR